MELHNYLFFTTQCEEALAFYTQCGLGKVTSLVRHGDSSILTVTDGKETLTVPLLWAFGRGQAGQTYVFEYDGAMYESRVSFYNALGALDLTMGARGGRPQSIAEAAGRRMDPLGARDCFACHSTGAVVAKKLHLETNEKEFLKRANRWAA